MFKNRAEAAIKLADELSRCRLGAGSLEERGLVLGIPRGGVVLAKVIADRLNWPIDVLITKKVGFPGQPELAMGAVVEDGEVIWDDRLSVQVSQKERDKQEKKARGKVDRYIKEFRGGKRLGVKGKAVVVVDDGIATGRTMEAGIKYLQRESLQVKRLIVAVPVCAGDTAERLKGQVDRWVCLREVEGFQAVGQFYRNFPQVSSEEVKELLAG